MRIPEILTPLVAKGITRLPEQVLTFWHETLLFIFPPGARFTLTYAPRTGYMYLVFGMTMGKVRDFATGDVLTTDDYGFWHRHGQMRFHWDPGVESVPAYSPIMVKYGQRGPIDVMPVEDLFHKLPGNVVFDGKHEVKEVEGEVYNFNYGKKYEKGTRRWSMIKRVFRHEYEGPLVRARTRAGMVDTSPNHSLIMRNGLVLDARKVRVGDNLAMPNLDEVFMDNDWNNSFIGPLDLAWLYGFYAAEGGLWTGEGPKALLSNMNRNFIDRSKQIYEENFHRTATLVVQDDGLCVLQMTGGWVAEHFKENFYTGQGHKRVPDFILNAEENVKRTFLRGYYDGDGLKNPEKTSLEQAFSTDSQTLAQGIMLLQHSLEDSSFNVYGKEGYPNTIEVRVHRGIGHRIPRGSVRQVSEIPYKGWMYDIEAESPHTFTTGVGPIKVHNSIYDFEYPHWLELTEEDPAELAFYNNTGLTVIQDFSIWLFECGAPQWKEHVVPYLKGHYMLFDAIGRMSEAELRKMVGVK